MEIMNTYQYKKHIQLKISEIAIRIAQRKYTVFTFQGKSPPHVLVTLLQLELSKLKELEAKTLYPESSDKFQWTDQSGCNYMNFMHLLLLYRILGQIYWNFTVCVCFSVQCVFLQTGSLRVGTHTWRKTVVGEEQKRREFLSLRQHPVLNLVCKSHLFR